MIPTYFVVKGLHLTNTLWSLMIPSAISAFNLIVLKNFFQQIPDGLEDSAKIDGCNDMGVLFRIVLPLSMPAMATFALFYSVTHWNQFLTPYCTSMITANGRFKCYCEKSSCWRKAELAMQGLTKLRFNRSRFEWLLSCLQHFRFCWCTHSCKSISRKASCLAL